MIVNDYYSGNIKFFESDKSGFKLTQFNKYMELLNDAQSDRKV